ncbi:MAG: nucleotide pyrophosphohydrolase [Myxococcota bacterium]|nr:nucleotide pyrophosphohydrolase [Myxococcota bacterium]
MTDAETTIAAIQKELKGFNEERDWDQYHSPRNLAMALSVEASELLELYLWSTDNGPQPPVSSRLSKVEDEAADVLICLLNFCRHAQIDLAAAVETKMRKNAEKYPVEQVRGRMEKHSEYT